MTRLLLTGILSSTLAVAGCATSQFDRHFEEGRYEEVGRLFQSDSSLQRDERSLYRAGLAHALPSSPIYRPEAADEIFERLLTLHPRSSYRPRVETLRQLLNEVIRLESTAEARETELERLARQAEEAKERIAWLESLLERQEAQTNSYRELAERLESQLRETRKELEALQEELQRLKEIDLKERRRTGQGTSPDRDAR